jgi:histidinol phosphatase-like PHP family hydrolase
LIFVILNIKKKKSHKLLKQGMLSLVKGVTNTSIGAHPQSLGHYQGRKEGFERGSVYQFIKTNLKIGEKNHI